MSQIEEEVGASILESLEHNGELAREAAQFIYNELGNMITEVLQDTAPHGPQDLFDILRGIHASISHHVGMLEGMMIRDGGVAHLPKIIEERGKMIDDGMRHAKMHEDNHKQNSGKEGVKS